MTNYHQVYDWAALIDVHLDEAEACLEEAEAVGSTGHLGALEHSAHYQGLAMAHTGLADVLMRRARFERKFY